MLANTIDLSMVTFYTSYHAIRIHERNLLMDSTNSIGIWGFGKVGKAYIQLLKERGYTQLSVMDKRELTTTEKELLLNLGVQFYTESENRDLFLQKHEYILPSPGIDVRSCYTQYANKFVNELDLFYTWWPHQIIAITGSVGKTTVTHLIGECLRYQGRKIAVGGNIGIATANLLHHAQEYTDGAVLEVSSFQLEHARLFAPYLALWTTFVPNHLDRHATEEEYFKAKYQLIAHQQDQFPTIVPQGVAQKIRNMGNRRSLHIVHANKDEINIPLEANDTLWTLHNNIIIRLSDGTAQPILDLSTIPPLTFTENLIMVTAALTICGLTSNQISAALHNCSLPAHRLEFLGKKNGIAFYNDSKSTTPASTLAAVQQLKNTPIILLLGGLSKGIDRKPLLSALHDQVKQIVCFGAEHEQLTSWCTEFGIPATSAATLDTAFQNALCNAVPGDTILLSPSGSSYDLFTDYQARGDYFRQLVNQYM